jgi:hypothetical protein
MRARERKLAGGAALGLALFGGVVWFGLGMNRGLLLSSDVKSRCWPWAPTWPVVAALQAPVLSDPVWQFVPWLGFARTELLAGRVPLWNPHQDGGVPLLGNGQSALLSPLLLPVLAFGVAAGWNLSLLLRVLLVSAGMFVLLRDWGRSAPAAALGGCLVALSGPFVAWLENPNTLVVAFVPWLLLAIRRVAAGVTRPRVMALALATFGVLTGGHVETAMFAAVLAAATLLAQRCPPSRRAAAVGASLLGALLAAPVLLPFAEYFSLSAARLGYDRTPFVLPLSSLVRFVAPHAPAGDPVTSAATVSLTGLTLAAVGLALRNRERQTWVWTIGAAAIVLVAYDNPLARTLATATPAYWTRALIFLPLCLAPLAAAGLDAVAAGARRLVGLPSRLVALALVATAGTELLLAARGVHAVTPAADLERTTPLLQALAADHEVFRVLPLHTFLPPNAATDYALDDLRGYDALAPRGWRDQRAAIGRFGGAAPISDAVEPWELSPGGHALDFWNVKYLLVHPQLHYNAARLDRDRDLDLEQVYAGADGIILRNRRVMPRARVLAGGGRVDVIGRDATRWVLQVTATAPALLEVANPYFPGWRASVDGAAAHIEARPGEAVHVALPPGSHRVELRYRPLSFACGVLLALAAAVALAGWVAVLPGARSR